ncbi:MAG: ribosomal protein S18-alanine N-acetyltransferase [Vicinamibacteria bacterium]|nr:ribosomal protein S18-alanine N-acetyltransferase [Vicinamibacteria bacterium]
MTAKGIIDWARQEDVPELASLAARSCTHPWTRAAFEGSLGNDRILVWRVPSEARRAWSVIAYCVYVIVADELQIHDLAVAPEFRRERRAQMLLSLGLSMARKRGARRAILEVRRSNQAAQALYEQAGFRLHCVRRDYYAEPREDALIMILEFEQAAC